MALTELFAALVSDPDDAEHYLVYGDALQATGDPHGELIALQVSQARSPDHAARERELREAFERELVGLPGIRVAWRFGFVVRAEIARGAVDQVLAARWLASHRCLNLLREVMFDHARPVPKDDAAQMIEALVEAPAAATIERIAIGNRQALAPSPELLAQLTEALPRLRGIELGAKSAPALAPLRRVAELALWCRDIRPDWVAGLAALPLRSLVLGFGSARRWNELAGSITALGELAGLEHLGLMHTGRDDRLVDELPARKLWPGLRSLGLSWSELTPTGEERLAAQRTAFEGKALAWPLPAGATHAADHAFRLGYLLRRRLQRPRDALPHYEVAVTAQHDVAEYWFGLGNVLSQLERPADAVRAFDRAVELEPGHASALFNRGRALAGLGQLAEATASLERATAANARHVNAWQELGLLHRRLGRVDQALACFAAATAIVPTHQAGRDRFDTLLEYGHPERALAQIEELLAGEPDDAQLARKHGRALLRLGRPGDALAIAAGACARAPGDYYNQYLHLAALRELGRHAEALAVCDVLADKPVAMLQRALLDGDTRVELPADHGPTHHQRATAAVLALCAAVIRGDAAAIAAARDRLGAVLADGGPGFVLDRRWDIVDTIDCVARAHPEHAALVARCYAVATGREPRETLTPAA